MTVAAEVVRLRWAVILGAVVVIIQLGALLVVSLRSRP